jgi:hypothetical protein
MDISKCDRPACSCTVQGEGFCSERCMLHDTREACGCEHAACTGTAKSTFGLRALLAGSNN